MTDFNGDPYDIFADEMSHYEYQTCPQCNGSGEGSADRTTCSRCHGFGDIPVLIRKEKDSDEE